MDILVPNYYPNFKCIGSLCEDTCCGWWSIDIDRATFRKYRLNKHPDLAPIFKVALSTQGKEATKNANTFGRMNLKHDGRCHFLQEDQLCSIQRIMGPSALSHTCSSYPRFFNQFGAQKEHSLAISCPEAARLVLLDARPITFELIPDTSDPRHPFVPAYRFPANSNGNPTQIAFLNDFRAVILAILQRREIRLGARLMLLGYFLEDANKVVSSSEFSDAAELTPIMQAYVAMLQQAQTLESQFEQIRPDVARKLEVITRLIQNVLSLEAPTRFSQTLQMAIEGLQGVPSDSQATEGGLLARYNLASDSYFKPYILNRAHIFENYLVNLVVTSLFPFTRGSYLDLYRELVFNVSILQVLLVGVATKHRGMNDELIVEVFHGYARKSDHDKRHLHNLANALCASNRDSFFEVMWMLRDAL